MGTPSERASRSTSGLLLYTYSTLHGREYCEDGSGGRASTVRCETMSGLALLGATQVVDQVFVHCSSDRGRRGERGAGP